MKQAREVKKMLVQFISCERGSTALEYGLIMALIFLVIIGAITTFADVATAKLQSANEAITSAG